MLAFTSDAALARLVIAATRLRQNKRGKWLRRLARELEPNTPTDNAIRCKAARERRRTHLKLKVSEIDVVEMLTHVQLLAPASEYTRQQLESALVFFITTWRTRLPRLESRTEPAPAERRAA